MKINFLSSDFKLRQNRLLDKHARPYNLKNEYPGLFTQKTKMGISSFETVDFSQELMEKFFDNLDELKIRRKNVEISFNGKRIWLNSEYWGGDYIKVNIPNAALFWFLSVSPLKFMLPEFISDTLQRKSVREVVYDLRYTNLKKSDIVKFFNVHRANIYRWIEMFEKSEVIRMKNECIYRTLHSLYCVNSGNNYRWYKFRDKGGILEFKKFEFTHNQLTDIDNLCGKMKKHIRRTKKQIAEENSAHH